MRLKMRDLPLSRRSSTKRDDSPTPRQTPRKVYSRSLVFREDSTHHPRTGAPSAPDPPLAFQVSKHTPPASKVAAASKQAAAASKQASSSKQICNVYLLCNANVPKPRPVVPPFAPCPRHFYCHQLQIFGVDAQTGGFVALAKSLCGGATVRVYATLADSRFPNSPVLWFSPHLKKFFTDVQTRRNFIEASGGKTTGQLRLVLLVRYKCFIRT